MNQEQHSFSNTTKAAPLEINLDEFMISEDSFKPMTKGLGFHHDLKRPSFKPAPKEVKPFGSATSVSTKQMPTQPLSLSTQQKAAAHVPSGLEAFYGQTQASSVQTDTFSDLKEETKVSKPNHKTAPMMSQLSAWIIDVLVIASFVAITGALLVLASGIEIQMYSKLISMQDLGIFAAAMFSIYYLLYFTILDLSASPGKTMMGLKVVKSDGKSISVRNTFSRAFISLLSGIALFLPMVLDFQGRLSDTKVVK
jgi:uncharacterized RDD family membrane protein YckC